MAGALDTYVANAKGGPTDHLYSLWVEVPFVESAFFGALGPQGG